MAGFIALACQWLPSKPEKPSHKTSLPIREKSNPSIWELPHPKYHINKYGIVETTESDKPRSQELPLLLPWAASVLGFDLRLRTPLVSSHSPPIPPPVLNGAFLEAAEEIFHSSQMIYDARERFRHSHGNTRKEVYDVRVGRSGGSVGRIPDMVIFPERVQQVRRLVEAADRWGACLIPYGGGTNTSQALKCPETESRMIVSVDMSRMNRIRWVDRENRLACIEAGAVGYQIEMSLARIGLCMGHLAEDMEFSTLGGWIATRASGGKKNRYGDIDDITLDVEAVTPMGVLEFSPNVDPRQSSSLDPKSFILGSEGELCLITAAIVKIRPFPAKKCYDSIIFPTFDKGIQFLNQVSKETFQPAGVRLVDNMQVQLSEALKPVPGNASTMKRNATLRYLETVKGFHFDKIAACVMIFEGRRVDVRRQRRNMRQIAKKFSGFETGPENGRRGYEMTSAISYIRDCLMAYSVISDSIEATCPWNKASALTERVKARVLRDHHRQRLPGRPLIVCRIGQIYPNGVSLYFSMTLFLAGLEDPVLAYTEFEEAVREEIYACGGSLSPRNGLGKLRKGSTPVETIDTTAAFNARVKQVMDPKNVFGCGNILAANR